MVRVWPSRVVTRNSGAWPGVRTAPRAGARLEIVAEPLVSVVRRLLAEDAALSELEIARAGLAEVFVALTTHDAETTAALEDAA